jgi:hypothetical protein
MPHTALLTSFSTPISRRHPPERLYKSSHPHNSPPSTIYIHQTSHSSEIYIPNTSIQDKSKHHKMCLFEASLKLAAVIDSAEASPSASSSIQTPLPSIPLLPAVTVEVQPITRISWSTHVEPEDVWRPDPTFVIREYSDPRVFFKRFVARCDYPKGKLVS